MFGSNKKQTDAVGLPGNGTEDGLSDVEEIRTDTVDEHSPIAAEGPEPVPEPSHFPSAPPMSDAMGDADDDTPPIDPLADAGPTIDDELSKGYMGTSSWRKSKRDDNSSEDSSSTPVNEDELLDIKQQALRSLAPLVGKLEQTPEEKFRTTMMLIQASDNPDLIHQAFDSANAIKDEKVRAQALLDVVNEINYFTQNGETKPSTD
jgi:hypothetical protein